MSIMLNQVEHSIEKSADRIIRLTAKLEQLQLQSIDLERLIRECQAEIDQEKRNAQYLQGLKARIYGC